MKIDLRVTSSFFHIKFFDIPTTHDFIVYLLLCNRIKNLSIYYICSTTNRGWIAGTAHLLVIVLWTKNEHKWATAQFTQLKWAKHERNEQKIIRQIRIWGKISAYQQALIRSVSNSEAINERYEQDSLPQYYNLRWINEKHWQD